MLFVSNMFQGVVIVALLVSCGYGPVSGQGIVRCPGECEYQPCGCCEEGMGLCKECHANGCDQCDDSGASVFKRGYSYYCEYCADIFGDACNFCQDNDGCGQCADWYDEANGIRYERVKDTTSGLWYCKPQNDDSVYVADCGTTIGSYPDHDPDPSCVPEPTWAPTQPTYQPSDIPTDRPSNSPTDRPSNSPTDRPSNSPTDRPSNSPTDRPSNSPTDRPSNSPTDRPSNSPTDRPSNSPTDRPSNSPTDRPTSSPVDDETGGSSGSGSTGSGSGSGTDGSTDGSGSSGSGTGGSGGSGGSGSGTGGSGGSGGSGSGSGGSGSTGSGTDGSETDGTETDGTETDDDGCVGVLNCPSTCENDPCDCDEVEHCMASTCHPNGCDQCESGYFKKDYNYHCAGCQETFGDYCMHCTDFLGCQQCSGGTVRTYDEDCGLYYCAEYCPPDTETDDTPDTVTDDTPSPTRSPVDDDDEPEPVAPTSVPTASPNEASTDCTGNEYFAVTSIEADNDYSSSVVCDYVDSGETLNDVPVYQCSDTGARAYVSDSGNIEISFTQDGVSYTLRLDQEFDNLNELVGTSDWMLVSGEEEATLTIAVYDCNGDSITISEDSCDSDCLDVTGFTISESIGDDLTHAGDYSGGADALNTRYCYDESCDCYKYEASLYSIEIRLNELDASYYVCFEYFENSALSGVSGEGYSVCSTSEFDVDTNGNFACQDVINDFLYSGASWTYSNEDFETEVTLDTTPDITFDDCYGADFYCGFGNHSMKMTIHSATILFTLVISTLLLFFF